MLRSFTSISFAVRSLMSQAGKVTVTCLSCNSKMGSSIICRRKADSLSKMSGNCGYKETVAGDELCGVARGAFRQSCIFGLAAH